MYRYNESRPFGFRKHNNLTFEKSVDRPNSRLRRVTRYLYLNGSKTRAEILADVFKRTTSNTGSLRGWGGYLFSGAVEAGFITKTRVGNKVFYDVGPSYLALK